MRYTAPEKLEIIALVERSSLSVRRAMARLGIPRSTFYGWYRRYAEGGVEALADRPPRPQRPWNRIPEETAAAVGRSVEYYNHERYHESLNNLAPADVCYGRGTNRLRMRRKIKQRTINERGRLHRQNKVA